MEFVTNDALKRMNEREIGENLLLEYNQAKGGSFEILRSGNPPEPDLICRETLSGELRGVEVVTVYYNQQHAERAWRRARGQDSDPYFIASDRTGNNKALDNLNEKIQEKCKKRYDFAGPITLVALVAPLRLHLDEYEDELDKICIPEQTPFDSIFVFSQIGQLHQLFPLREWIVP